MSLPVRSRTAVAAQDLSAPAMPGSMPLVTSQVNSDMVFQKRSAEPLPLWPTRAWLRTVPSVPAIRDEDRVFAERLGAVLRRLRAVTRETRPEAAERLGVSETSLGRWERGEFAPKGYDLGRL